MPSAVFSGFIDAQRLLGQVISRRFVGAGPTTAADPDEFAAAALPLVAAEVPEIPKDPGFVPDLAKPPLGHVAAIELQVAAGLDQPRVGDEAEGAAPEASTGHGMKRVSTVAYFRRLACRRSNRLRLRRFFDSLFFPAPLM